MTSMVQNNMWDSGGRTFHGNKGGEHMVVLCHRRHRKTEEVPPVVMNDVGAAAQMSAKTMCPGL